jgi:hypothetical protein
VFFKSTSQKQDWMITCGYLLNNSIVVTFDSHAWIFFLPFYLILTHLCSKIKYILLSMKTLVDGHLKKKLDNVQKAMYSLLVTFDCFLVDFELLKIKFFFEFEWVYWPFLVFRPVESKLKMWCVCTWFGTIKGSGWKDIFSLMRLPR